MIWVVVLAYNEGKNLRGVVMDIARALTVANFKIVIVNDGSADDTLSVAQALAAQFPVVVVNHAQNRGVAEAFRSGITEASRRAQSEDSIVIMEGDGTSDAALLPDMAQRIRQGADVVIASRYQRGGGYQRFPIKRLILSRGANFIFRWLFPIPGVRDYSIFYRAYRAGVLQQALEHYGQRFITVQTFFANIEILLHIRQFTAKVEEVPMRYDYGKKQGKSGMNVWRNLQSYLLFIAQNAYRRSDT